MPFRIHDELSTADVAFEAWGTTQEELFVSSAMALLQAMAEKPEQIERRLAFTIRLAHKELDMLLFIFLQELIYYKDARRLLLHAETVRIEERKDSFTLEANVKGEQIDSRRHLLGVDVKAVTMYRFRVMFADNTWKAAVVLDV